MREECSECCPVFVSTGITPAHAGRIEPKYSPVRQLEDHPRACGKNVSFPPVDYYWSGITPAHAGRIWYAIDYDGVA